MLEIFEGRPGGGKTYTAVRDLVRYLAQGSIVVTNVFLYPEKVLKYCYDEFSVEVPPESLIYVEDGTQLAYNISTICPVGSREVPNKIILDEAHTWYNSRDWKQNHETLRKQFLWCTQHRKFFTDITFITQDANNIDAQFRRLAQYYKRYRDLARVKIPFFGDIYPLPHTLEILVDYDGNTVMGRTVIPRSKDIFNLYESEQILMDAGFRKDVRKSNIKVDKRRRKQRLAVMVCQAVLVFGLLVELYIFYMKAK